MYRSLLSALILTAALSSNAFAQITGEECNPFAVEVMTTPAPSTNPAALADYAKLNFPETADIIFLGDSIGVAQYYQWGFDQGRDKYSSKFLFAYGGDQFQMALDKLLRHKDELAKLDPKIAFVFLGSNSISYSPCAMAKGMENYITNLREALPSTEIVVMSVLPRGKMFRQSNTSRVEFNKFLRENASRLGVKLIEFEEDELTCGIYGFYYSVAASSLKLGPSVEKDVCGPDNMRLLASSTPMAQGNVSLSCSIEIDMNCENFKPDNTHPTEIGSRKINEAIRSQLGEGLTR